MLSKRIVTVAKYDDVMQAELAVQTLADHEIMGVLNGKNFAGMYAGLGIGLFGVRLQVLESDAAKAIEILDDVENAGSDD
ncbi:MAG: DUF2007 domain-containing protein [Planctomycetes bacterium]|nr:DUF2007 domain-containing protein [Planctomycetota bacterium]